MTIIVKCHKNIFIIIMIMMVNKIKITIESSS